MSESSLNIHTHLEPHELEQQANQDESFVVTHPWIRHYEQGVPAHIEIPDHPLTWLLDRTASRYPGRTALIYFGRRLSYAQLAQGARVVLCGLMDQYNDGPPSMVPAGPLIGRRATVHGLVVYDHEDLRPRFMARVTALLREGRLRLLEERHAGLAAAPAAFCRLMRGANVGKVIVEVAARGGTA